MTTGSALRVVVAGMVLGVFGAGCGGAGTPTTSPPAQVASSGAQPWEARALFGFGELGLDWVDREREQFIADGMRVELHGEEVRFAATHSYDPFMCGVRVESGYLFLTNTGALYSASEFLGPLTPRGTPGEATSCLVSLGVMVATQGRNDLLFAGADGSSWRLPEALRGHVVDAAFRAPHVGIVIVSPGVALLTTDNVTYAPIDFGRRTVVSTWPEAERWVVQTSDGWFAVSDAGEVSPLDGTPGRLGGGITDEIFERIDTAARAKQPVAFSDSLPGPDGRLLVRLDPEYVEGDVSDLPLETWSAGTGLEALPSPGRDCQILPWGGRAIASCPDAIFMLEHTTWRHVEDSDGARVVAARDGSTFAVLDVCERPQRRDVPSTCGRTIRIHDGERWRTRTLPARVALLDVHGSHALVENASDRALRVVSVDTEANDRTISVPAPFITAMVRFDASGGLWGSAWGERQNGVTPTSAVVAPPGGQLTEVTLPAEALGFEMADALHGMTVGDRLDEVWVTTDGARSWQPLALPGTGDASSVELPVNERGGTSPVLQCSAVACRVHYAWLWGAPAALAGLDPEGRLLFARGAPETVAFVWTRPESTGAWRTAECNVPASSGEEWSERAQRATGSIALDGDQLRWAFHENGRSFESASAQLASERVTELTNGQLEPLLITPGFALFDHCVQPVDGDEPDPDPVCGALHLVRSNQAPLPFELPVPALRDDDLTYLVASHPLPRGRTALHFGVTRSDRGRIYDIVVELAADGQEVRSRSFVIPPRGHVRWLAVRGNLPGLLLGAPGSADLQFHGIDGSAAVPVALPSETPTALCARSAAVVSVVADDAYFGPRLGITTDESRAYSPWVRLAAAASCLQGYLPRPTPTYSDEPSVIASRWLSFEVARGVLQVRTLQPGGAASEPVVCSVAAAD